MFIIAIFIIKTIFARKSVKGITFVLKYEKNENGQCKCLPISNLKLLEFHDRY